MIVEAATGSPPGRSGIMQPQATRSDRGTRVHATAPTTTPAAFRRARTGRLGDRRRLRAAAATAGRCDGDEAADRSRAVRRRRARRRAYRRAEGARGAARAGRLRRGHEHRRRGRRVQIGTRRRLSVAPARAGSATAAVFAQPPQPPVGATATRPQIGLVLSGGGARGGAHIGVLKALEELRVPVDYVAGTSIGAVVGGFYVSGMSVADLEQLVESLEWEAAFLNVTPRQLKSFRRKRDDDSFLVNQKPGLNDGEFELPIGLVQGQVVDMIISRATLRASQVENFDQLAIPFRAVAGDLVTGEAVVLGSGSLARAIRASMSIPAALSPIEIDGRLLVDGGIAMNLPVDVARDMGADIVIAVDISSELLGRDTLRSVLDITSQLTNLLTRNGTLEQRAKLTPNDVLLVPTFGEELTSTDFTRMRETIQTGYDAVMENRENFERPALT